MKHLALVLSLLVLPVGCATTKGAQAEENVDPRELVANGAALIDVRTPEEYASGHIEGAKLMPIAELESRLAELEPKERPVVVYCRSGGRSEKAAEILRANGFKKVYDLGGMENWNKPSR